MIRAGAIAAALGLLLFAAGCKDDPPAPPLRDLTPKPLPKASGAEGPLPALPAEGERDLAYQVAHAPVFGDPVPRDAARVEWAADGVQIDGQPFDLAAPDAPGRLRERLGARPGDERPVLLVPGTETFLMQAAPLFAALDDARVPTHLLHPDGQVSFRVTLSDERDFRTWLEQSTAGQVRVIHRADGFELVTNLGKLPGADPNGPSVPLRGGQWDLARLRAGLVLLQERFHSATESCLVPSFGMELSAISRALTAYYTKPGSRLFPALCLVYPRPRTAADDAGG